MFLKESFDIHISSKETTVHFVESYNYSEITLLDSSYESKNSFHLFVVEYIFGKAFCHISNNAADFQKVLTAFQIHFIQYKLKAVIHHLTAQESIFHLSHCQIQAQSSDQD
jgi:hypothetical protein